MANVHNSKTDPNRKEKRLLQIKKYLKDSPARSLLRKIGIKVQKLRINKPKCLTAIFVGSEKEARLCEKRWPDELICFGWVDEDNAIHLTRGDS